MNKRTKIVATVGPSTNSKEIIENMIKQGVNVLESISLMAATKIILKLLY